MIEDYNKVRFFIGPEVEHTPAFSKKTLFVVGEQNVDETIRLAEENNTPHIYLGANQSFALSDYWNTTITTLLSHGFTVTLDYPAHMHNEIFKTLNAETWQSRLFVPLLSVRISGIETASTNLTVKIDDEFQGVNEGVWCLHFHELTDSNRFTGWGEYASDEVIAEVQEPVAVEKVADSEVKNSQEIGLDPDAKSLLKPEPTPEVEKEQEPVVTTTNDAAVAYAKGAKKDPLSEKPVAKKSKAK